MIELLKSYLHIIIPYIPLGVIGIYRWSIWITKKIIAKKYRPVSQNGYSNTLSVVVPVYNENPDVFETALESWANNKPDEIIAVIDYTDEACINRFKKFQEKYKNSQLIITQRPGKREALSDGIKAAQYNIIALVDSDTIWDLNIKDILLYPFIDPLVGGVGPRQDVLHANTLARKLFSIYLDQRYSNETKYLATVSNTLTCISGRTAFYRKEAIKDLCDELENETFWGVKCISGDDKCLTRLIQERGWKTRYQNNARVLTAGAPDLLTFFKQYLRWTRNSYRSDLKSLTSTWIWKKEKFLAFQMIDAKTQSFTLIIGPIYFILSIIWGHWLIAGILLIWWHLSRGIKLYSHLKAHPSDILILPFYILTTYLMAVLKIYAMVTIREQGWITRWDKNRLQSGLSIIFRVSKSIASYLSTILIIALLSFIVVKYEDITKISHYIDDVKSIENKNMTADNCYQAILGNSGNEQFKYYTVEKKDTLSTIIKRYNSNLFNIIQANKDIIANPDYIKIGQQIKIPITELGTILTKEKLVSLSEPEVTFDKSSKTIYVNGRGSVVTLPKIYNALSRDSVIEKLNNKEWLLKANLLVKQGVTLVIDDSDVSWLKLKSDKNEFVWLQSNGGSILIKNTKITSWDEGNQAPDGDYGDGRSFISARQNGRMDIINSELSFLGYENGFKSGVALHASNDNSKNYLITGQILDNKFHNNYSGIYLSDATGTVIANNEISNNDYYGVKITNGANSYLIKDNRFYNNNKGDYSCS